MRHLRLSPTVFFTIIAVVAFLAFELSGQIPLNNPKPKLIEFDFNAREYVPILGGSPETVTMHSGFVNLEASKNVGKHSTESNEEAVIVLSGKGEMRIVGGPVFQLKRGVVAYCPPHTEHDVYNTGKKPLKYIYVVSKASEKATDR